MLKKIHDHSLVKATLRGDSNAFAKLVSLYSGRVRALGLSFFKNETDADDFVQDVFIKAYTALSSFRFESQFSTWLIRIAYNIAINAINRRKQCLSLAEESEILDPSVGTEDTVVRKITAEAIRAELKNIPEQYAICLDMYFFYDMSYVEISEVIDIPVNTIKSHVFRAKKLLRERLKELK